MSVHFEERSGVVPCKTPWGSWYQTMEEVFIEVHVPPGTSAKEVKCRLGSRDIELQVRGKEVFKKERSRTLLKSCCWHKSKVQKLLRTESNPGFDFSGAEISGNFAGGGPDFSSLQK
uniref:CS domain-containing protein n=1 Tax=Fundulus heteroclitus TaxID=8078 RepID=A0A3Q2PBA2_FUNHE